MMPSQEEAERNLRHIKQIEDGLATKKPDSRITTEFRQLQQQADELRAKLPGTYLYIFEDGTIVRSPEPPTVCDFMAVDEGTLQVIRIKAGEIVFLTPDGVVEIPPAATNTDPTLGLFHDKDVQQVQSDQTSK